MLSMRLVLALVRLVLLVVSRCRDHYRMARMQGLCVRVARCSRFCAARSVSVDKTNQSSRQTVENRPERLFVAGSCFKFADDSRSGCSFVWKVSLYLIYSVRSGRLECVCHNGRFLS